MHNCQQGHETNYFCLMMGNTTVVRQPFKAQNLTSEHTRHALDFLQWSAEAAAPFFFIYNFMHVHTPLFSSPPFAGISKAGGKFPSPYSRLRSTQARPRGSPNTAAPFAPLACPAAAPCAS